MARRTELGTLLRQHRETRGWTQAELAERAELSVRAISDLERGIHPRARRSTLEQIAAACGLTEHERHQLRTVSGDPADGPTIPLPPELTRAPHRVFAGREVPRERLEAAWSAATAGATRMVLLTGEAGIGKSTLARVSADAWHRDGASVLLGHSDEKGEAYRPIVEALGPAITVLSAHRVTSQNGTRVALLATLFPQLEVTAPDRRSVGDQIALFDAVRGFLTAVTEIRPCLLVLEDLGWADPDTIAMLRHLVRAGSGRLLVVGTARLDGTEGNEAALRDLVVDLRRIDVLDHVPLNGLADADIATILRARAGVAPPALVERLQHETNGNPFFVHDLVEHLAQSDALRDDRWRRAFGAGLGPGLDAGFLLDQWMRRLSAPVQELLGVAAIIGTRFDLASLRSIGQVDEHDVLEAMDEAVAAGLVCEDTAFGWWVFVHGITRAHITASMTRNTRASLHARVAELHETSADPDADIEGLAYHYWHAMPLGGFNERAARAAQRSAERAASLFAWEDAALAFEHALEALGHDETSTALRCALSIALGRALTESLQRHRARPAFVEAARLALQLQDSAQLVDAAYGYSFMTKQGDADPEGLRIWQGALDVASDDDHEARSILLSACSTAHRLGHDVEEVRATSVAALAEALETPSARARNLAFATFSAALWDSPELQTRIDAAEEMIALARSEHDVDTELDGLSLLVLPLLAAGRTREVDDEIAHADRLAHEHHRRISLGQVVQWQAMRAQMRGRFDEARRLADQALDISGAAPNFAMGHIALHYTVRRLEDPDAPLELPYVEPEPREQTVTVWRAAVAAAAATTGDLDRARTLLDHYLPLGRMRIEPGWTHLLTMAFLAEAASALKDSEMCRQVDALLAPFSGQLVVVASGTSCEGAVDYFRGLLALTCGDGARAETFALAAVDLEHVADAPALAARSEALVRTARAGRA